MENNRSNNLDYISKLELKKPDLTLLPPAEKPIAYLEGQPEGMVIFSLATAFTANVSPQNKDDVKNSVLFAQFAADAKVDRYADPVGWYKFFNEVLNNLGWITRGFEFQDYKDDDGTFTIDEEAVRLVGSLFTGNEVIIIKASLDALKALSDDNGAFKLFDKTTSKSEKGNFQVGLVDENNGDVIFGTGAFYFISTTSTSRFLWVTHSSSNMKLFEGTQSMMLNSQVYSHARDKVSKRLGEHARISAQTYPIELPDS